MIWIFARANRPTLSMTERRNRPRNRPSVERDRIAAYQADLNRDGTDDGRSAHEIAIANHFPANVSRQTWVPLMAPLLLPSGSRMSSLRLGRDGQTAAWATFSDHACRVRAPIFVRSTPCEDSRRDQPGAEPESTRSGLAPEQPHSEPPIRLSGPDHRRKIDPRSWELDFPRFSRLSCGRAALRASVRRP